MTRKLQLLAASDDLDYRNAASLFLEYAQSLTIDLEFQDFSNELELDTIRSMYGAPEGKLFLVYDGSQAIACAGFRKLDNGICELKRMYVKPAYRGKQIGQLLMDALIQDAINAGYSFMRLDTLSQMTPAVTLYRKNGFYTIPAYYHNPIDDVLYFERKLI